MTKQPIRQVLEELKSIRTDDLLTASSVDYCIKILEGYMRLHKPAAYQAHSDTSKEAAAEISPHVSRLESLVLDAIRYSDGLTDEEGQERLSLSGNTYRPRRSSLADKGLVRDSGDRRINSSGRKAASWSITPLGIKTLQEKAA
jgi:hypothetical protein